MWCQENVHINIKKINVALLIQQIWSKILNYFLFESYKKTDYVLAQVGILFRLLQLSNKGIIKFLVQAAMYHRQLCVLLEIWRFLILRCFLSKDNGDSIYQICLKIFVHLLYCDDSHENIMENSGGDNVWQCRWKCNSMKNHLLFLTLLASCLSSNCYMLR